MHRFHSQHAASDTGDRSATDDVLFREEPDEEEEDEDDGEEGDEDPRDGYSE